AAFYGKVLRSAVANASHDESVNMNRLFVAECRADDGPLLQGRLRYRPGPQGRAMPFAKRLSHLVVKVRELEDAGAPRKGSIEKGSIEEPAPAAAEAPAKSKKPAKARPKKAPAAKETQASAKKTKGKKGKGEEKKA